MAGTAVLVVVCTAAEARSGAVLPRARESSVPFTECVNVPGAKVRVQH